MKYLSVCSGIEAASVAWHDLGWEPVAFSEIAPFPSAVLRHHYPGVPNLGDFTQIGENDVGPIDLVVGGTPCQDFSVAGLRAGLAGERGHLTIEFVRLLERTKPRWFVWENVPGVLSVDKGRAFGVFLGALDELGYSCAWRVLDAKHFGVPQRRRRVFVVGCLGNWRAPAEVLFEPEGVLGDIAQSDQEGQTVTALTANGVGTCGADDNQAQGGHLIVTSANEIAPTLPAREGRGGGLGTDFDCDGGLVIAGTIGAEHGRNRGLGNENEVDLIVAFSSKDYGADASATCPTLRACGHDKSHPNGGAPPAVVYMSDDDLLVRRVTPRECERLQGFPDDYTLVPVRTTKKGKVVMASDGPRYKACGNSMAVPVVRWIGERIALIELLGEHDTAA
ncbi:MAG: DNA cytosine methyltransferase [Vulcanimicrobiaceae bacterium]